MQANCKFFIPIDLSFCVYEKKYGNEWMNFFVDLSVLQLVC